MKISPDPHTPIITNKKSNSATVKSASIPEPQSQVPNNGSVTQQKIRGWFSRVGISSSQIPKDKSSVRNELERRKELLAIQRTSNLQAILNIALNVSISESSSDSVDPDWFFAFTSMAEEIYSPAMQELWGKIFAVEVNRPGSFSLRSLQTLKSLTHRDAKLFSKAASMASKRSNELIPRILVGYRNQKRWYSVFTQTSNEQINLASVGLSYPDLLALQDMNLLYVSEIEGGTYALGQQSKWRCGTTNYALTCKADGTLLTYYKFTAVGAELFKLVPKADNSAYLDTLFGTLDKGFAISGK